MNEFIPPLPNIVKGMLSTILKTRPEGLHFSVLLLSLAINPSSFCNEKGEVDDRKE